MLHRENLSRKSESNTRGRTKRVAFAAYAKQEQGEITKQEC